MPCGESKETCVLFGLGLLEFGQDFISHEADFADVNEVFNCFHEPDRIRTVLRW